MPRAAFQQFLERFPRTSISMMGVRGSVAAVLLILLAGFPALPDASAQSLVQWTEPAASEHRSETPDEIRIRFSQPLDPAGGSLRVLDRSGKPVVAGDASNSADNRELALPLPHELSDGVYTVQWAATPSNSGEPESGFYAFSVGSQEIPLVSSPPESQLTDSTSWLDAAARAIALIGTTAAAGLLLVWLTVLRPVLITSGINPRGLGNQVRRLAFAGVALAATGALSAIVLEVQRAGGGIANLQRILTESSDGSAWLLQLVHLIFLSAGIAIPALWGSRQSWKMPVIGLIAAGSALSPMALSSHAGRQTIGYLAGAANQWVHLLGISVLVGALLLIGFLSTRQPETWRSAVNRQFWLRLGFLAGVSAIALGLTGLYAFHLNAGSVAALTETGYGEILIPKLLLSGIVLAVCTGFAAYLWRRSSESVRRHFVAVLAGVVLLLVTGALAQSGRLATEEFTGREAYLAQQERQEHEFVAGDLRGVLYLTPGVAGHNRFTLDLSAPGATLSDTAQTLVRATPKEGVIGQRERLLLPQDICTADGEVIDSPVARYEGEGLDLSLAGEWDLDVVVQRLDGENARIPLSIAIADVTLPDSSPGPPLRFDGIQPALAFLAGTAALVLGGLMLVRRRRGEGGADLYGMIAGVLLVFTVLALWNGRITHTPDAQARNPIPRTVESVETGRNVYLEHCAVCHGADATGEGEAGPQLERPPADLTASHMDSHPAGDIAYWIQNGIDPAMPGFADQLTDDEVWNLVNYLRSLRHPLDEN